MRMALVLFSETCRTAAYSHLHKTLCVTDEYLEQFFVCFSTKLRMNYWGGGVIYQFDRNNLSVVLTWHHGT